MKRRLNEEKYTKLFKKIIERRGWKFTPSSADEDMFDHIDGRIHIIDRGHVVEILTVDLKGHKFRSRNSNVLCQYIEFMNVRGEKGWLFGKSDIIAVLSEDEKEFYVIYMEDLKEFCANLFGICLECTLTEIEGQLQLLDCWVDSPEKAYHKLYRRRKLKDIVTQITMSDVKKLARMKI